MSRFSHECPTWGGITIDEHDSAFAGCWCSFGKEDAVATKFKIARLKDSPFDGYNPDGDIDLGEGT